MSEPAFGEWRPIESAKPPEDGKWCVFTSTWNMYARWCGQWERGQGWIDQFECGSDLSEFTHWMLLPGLPTPAPSLGGEGREGE